MRGRQLQNGRLKLLLRWTSELPFRLYVKTLQRSLWKLKPRLPSVTVGPLPTADEVDDLDSIAIVDVGLLPFGAAYDALVYFDRDPLRRQSQLAHQFRQNDLIMI